MLENWTDMAPKRDFLFTVCINESMDLNSYICYFHFPGKIVYLLLRYMYMWLVRIISRSTESEGHWGHESLHHFHFQFQFPCRGSFWTSIGIERLECKSIIFSNPLLIVESWHHFEPFVLLSEPMLLATLLCCTRFMVKRRELENLINCFT